MTANQAANLPVKSALPVIDEKYRSLLNPIPRPSARTTIWIVIILALIIWSFIGAGVNIGGIIAGIPAGIRFVQQLFPLTFELTTVTATIGGATVSLQIPLVIQPIIQTIQMALIGTLGAAILAVPLALLAARNISPNPIIYQGTRLVLNLARALPTQIYALIFVSVVGLNPLAGVLALIIGSLGSLSRHYAESIEQIDPSQVMAVRATGANQAQIFGFAVIPQALPLMLAYTLSQFEFSVRDATILAIVGAGGVGLYIQQYIALYSWHNLGGLILLLVIVVTVVDRISAYIRRRII